LWVGLWAPESDVARQLNLLSPKFVETTTDPGRYSDGGGLYLQVTAGKNGGVTKSWLFRYMRGGTTSREMGLGAMSMRKGDGYTTLRKARQKRTHARELLESGIDPLEVKRSGKIAEKLDKAKAMTFAQCAAEYIRGHEKGWKGQKHVKLWRGSLAKYVEPKIGGLPIASIDTGLVLKVLRPIWETKTKTAVDIRSRIELILNWAKIHGYRDGENPARWKGHLDNALPKPSRIAKVTGWFEIDAGKKVWTIPAARMKAASDHRVPLTDRAIEILEKLSRGTKFVFSGKNPNKKLPHEGMLKVLKTIEASVTVHGFRSTFRDWAAEQTAHPNEVAEMALAHKISSKVEAAYRRGDLFEKRRQLMADWAAYCSGVQK
jgi:integrase